jgi:hypothetical protein
MAAGSFEPLPPYPRGVPAGAKCALVLWRGGLLAQEGSSNARARAAGGH